MVTANNNQERKPRAFKINIKLTVALVLLLLLLIFIIQNAVVVELHFLIWTLSMSRSLIIIFSIFIGIVMGWLLNSFVYRKWQKSKTPRTQTSAGKINNQKTSDNE
jgi:uncharacterized integral membrane protein